VVIFIGQGVVNGAGTAICEQAAVLAIKGMGINCVAGQWIGLGSERLTCSAKKGME